MINQLDVRIARVVAELTRLRRQKLGRLWGQESESKHKTSGPKSPPTPKPQTGKITDEEATQLLMEAVEAAGEKGISARRAAAETGISYVRVRRMMPMLFKRTGKDKQTLYFPKKKRRG